MVRLSRFVMCAVVALMAFPVLSEASALVRVVHASSDAPAVDVLVDGGVAFEGLRFKDYTNYTPVPAGSHLISVNAAGTSTTVLSSSFTLADGVAYTFYAVGQLGNSTLTLFGTGDELTAPASGSTKVRIVHAASTAPAVDVYVSAPFAKLPDSPLLSGVPFTVASDYLTVPAGTYQGRVAVAGTKTIAINSGRLPLTPGTVRTIVALDPMPAAAGEKPGSFELFVLNDVN